MFNVIDDPIFTRTVRVQVPKGDGHEEQTFKCKFRVGDDDETNGTVLGDAAAVKEMLRGLIVSMSDLCDGDGQPVAYSDDVREAVLKRSYARLALIHAYYSGTVEGRAGN